jgi:hypothetical protein
MMAPNGHAYNGFVLRALIRGAAGPALVLALATLLPTSACAAQNVAAGAAR